MNYPGFGVGWLCFVRIIIRYYRKCEHIPCQRVQPDTTHKPRMNRMKAYIKA
jgi:hypothetical protein